MKYHLKENQMEGLKEIFSLGMIEEMEEDSIFRQLLKGTREIDRRKSGQYRWVFEEEVKTSQ